VAEKRPENSIMSDHSTTESPPKPAAIAEQSNRNGAAQAADPSAAPTSNSSPPASTDGESATSRADQVVDNLSLKIAVTASTIGRGVLRLVARTREEVSDIWAEAQSLRRGEKQ
jgi:hypothetical protein